MKKYLLNVLRTFFVQESTFYSVHVIKKDRSGTVPLCEWFRGFNPPRVGEFISVEVEDTTNEPKPQKRFRYYKVERVTHIFYRTKHTKNGMIEGKKEAVIIVRYYGDGNPTEI